MIALGIDTSNYTTSVAVYNSADKSFISKKMLLPVREGEKGLRQSDAVFHHVKQLPVLTEELFSEFSGKIDCVGVSVSPRDAEGSYMPCFLTGIAVAEAVKSANHIPLFGFSHQQGHIAAVLETAGRRDLFSRSFIAFHVSGGTTEAVLVSPDNEKIIRTELVFSSSDLKAGQAVDRIGLTLGLNFPCGPQLDALACKSGREFNIKPSFRDNTVSLSGVENQCNKMLESGEAKEDIAKYCIDYISASLEKAVRILIEKYGKLPLVFSGGVMSNSIISKRFTEKYNAVFTSPQYSSDNALGIAVLAAEKGVKND
jgi:N6-L-threonylcarbamoyladenine synthase